MGIELPLLAMAFHEAGQTKEAADNLDRAAAKLDDWINESLEVNQGAPALPWFDWVEFISTFEEASEMIRPCGPRRHRSQPAVSQRPRTRRTAAPHHGSIDRREKRC